MPEPSWLWEALPPTETFNFEATGKQQPCPETTVEELSAPLDTACPLKMIRNAEVAPGQRQIFDSSLRPIQIRLGALPLLLVARLIVRRRVRSFVTR